jgi:L-ascorbate metabolism protein UlaG (beta-lactamase superfamily)
MKILLLLLAINLSFVNPMENNFTKDVFDAGDGKLSISFIGHGTLMFEYNDMVIHIDPTMREADYATMPDADLILITHHHGDHLDLAAINHIIKKDCPVVMTQSCLEQLEDFKGAVIMKNGDQKTIRGIPIEAIPAYNIEHKRSNGQLFHPKGAGNAYVVSIGDLRVLIGGDTENVPEIKALKNIEIAFLPMNLPYTMTPEMVADAARAMQPRVLYPYHFGQTDPSALADLLKDQKNIEVRIRALQ